MGRKMSIHVSFLTDVGSGGMSESRVQELTSLRKY